MWDEKTIRIFRSKLLRWYSRHKRVLPWRTNPTPYRVWISEIMLQQTQTRSVLRYYGRFLRRFPNLASLAQATEADVLELWAGLGYYSRARNIHRAARQIMRASGGFPEDFNAILALPGIGRYTAGAICSIAFNKPYPVVDGNIRRILTRLSGRKGHIPEGFFWKVMSAWIPPKTPSSFNQGMMELGALICLPSQPRCRICPVQIFCKTKKSGVRTTNTGAHVRRVSRNIRIAVLILEQNHSLLLSRQSGRTLIPGNWALPWQVVPDQKSAGTNVSELCRTILGYEIPLKPCEQVKHAISNNRIVALGFSGRVELKVPPLQIGDGLRWVHRATVLKFLTSSLFIKVLEKKC
jgi:A/G-specific adenine glycosylase